jgi:peptide/nickel transport system substrate-binding protein
MHKRVWFLVAAAAGVLMLAGSAAAMTVSSSSASTQASASTAFAKAFANVPRTPAGRAANSTINFAMEQDAGGFNLQNLNLTGSWAAYFGETPEIRGDYMITNTGKYILDMASKVQATKKFLRIWIRKDANWNWQGHKPFPVTAADYVYTWKQFVTPGNAVASTTGYTQITRAKVNNAKEVTFYWKAPFADYKDLFGYIYPKKALAGQSFNTFWSDCVCGYPDKKPISDGPYFLQSWTPGAGLILKSNPSWYGKKPAISTIVGKLYDAEASEINAFKAGEVDAIYPGQPITSMTSLLHQSGVVHKIVPGYTQEHMDVEFKAAGSGAGGTHTANGAYLLNKPWFNQALAMGLNRQPVINAVYAGVLPPNTVKPLNNPFYTVGSLATAKKYQYFAKYSNNPKGAIALLKKHGCTGGPSTPGAGGTWSCQGHSASINFYTTTAPARCSVSMPAWIQQEKAVGIKLNTHCYTAQPDFFTNLLPTGNFDLAEYAFQGTPDPAGWDSIYQCVQHSKKTHQVIKGGQNYKNYCDPKVDRLMRKADRELNPTKRTAEVQAAAKLVSTDVAIIPLYARPSFLFYNSKIKGMSTSDNPTSEGPLWLAQNWSWGK